MTQRKKPNHYVDNEKLYLAMKDFIEKYNKAVAEGTQLPQPSNYIGKSVTDIAEGWARSPKFNRYTFKQEMIEDGIENVFKYIHNFDPVKYSNPHAYFSQIIYFAFLRRIKLEQKDQYIKAKLLIDSSIFNGFSELSHDDMVHINDVYPMINDPDFIERYQKLKNIFEPDDDKAKEDKPKKKKGIEAFLEDKEEELEGDLDE